MLGPRSGGSTVVGMLQQARKKLRLCFFLFALASRKKNKK
jgi:hypothetical protein